MNAKKANNFQRLRELPPQKQLLTGAVLLERMLPNYQLFSEVTTFGDSHVMASVLGVIWERVAHRRAKVDYAKQIEKVEENTPEEQDFDMFGVYPVIYFSTALISMFQALESEESRYIVDVSKISQATVSKLIEAELGDALDESDNKQIREHELMQYEMAFLSELLDEVEALSTIDKSTLKAMKLYARKDGISNIGIEFID